MKKIKIRTKKIDKMPSGCKEFQTLFRDYVWGKLPFDVETALVHHVRGCEDCMDDLRAYFMFSTALHYLENNDSGNTGSDISELLLETERKEQELKRRRKTVFIGIAALLILSALTVFVVYTDYFGGV